MPVGSCVCACVYTLDHHLGPRVGGWIGSKKRPGSSPPPAFKKDRPDLDVHTGIVIVQWGQRRGRGVSVELGMAWALITDGPAHGEGQGQARSPLCCPANKDITSFNRSAFIAICPVEYKGGKT